MVTLTTLKWTTVRKAGRKAATSSTSFRWDGIRVDSTVSVAVQHQNQQQ